MPLVVTASGVAKLRRDPRVVRVISEVVGVPLKWFPWLAACEFAGGLGLLVGIVWPPLGVAASVGVLLYFLCAMIAHVRVGDFNGLGRGDVPALPCQGHVGTRVRECGKLARPGESNA